MPRPVPVTCVLIAVACSPVPNDTRCLRPTRPPCDLLSASCRDAYVEATACMLGMKDFEVPPTRIITAQDLADEIQAWMDDPEYAASWQDLDDWGQALALMDLADPETTATQSVTAIEASTVPAYYEVDLGRITVLEDFVGNDAQARSIFLHEATHALQDQREDLADFISAYSTNSERSLALAASIEGEAEVTQIRAALVDQGVRSRDVFWGAYFSTLEQDAFLAVVGSDDPVFLSRRYFPYAWGAERMFDAFDTEGLGGVEAVFSDPPLATSRFLFDPGVDGSGALGGFADTSPPLEGWELFDEDVLGAWHLGVLASRRGNAPGGFPHEVSGWRDDLMSTWRGPDGDVAFVWRVAAADPDAAMDIATAIDGDGPHLAVDGSQVVLAASTVPGDAAVWLAWALDEAPQARRALRRKRPGPPRIP